MLLKDKKSTFLLMLPVLFAEKVWSSHLFSLSSIVVFLQHVNCKLCQKKNVCLKLKVWDNEEEWWVSFTCHHICVHRLVSRDTKTWVTTTRFSAQLHPSGYIIYAKGTVCGHKTCFRLQWLNQTVAMLVCCIHFLNTAEVLQFHHFSLQL